jgi:3-methylfumaryl-CoA hydratase
MRDPALLDELPPLWHWLYFLNPVRRGDLGADGHALVAGHDPTQPKRRMFAAARAEFLRPLRLGRAARMAESVIRSRDTQGSGGPLRIVTYGYHYFQDDHLCIREERDIVYLEPTAPQAASIIAGRDARSAGIEVIAVTAPPPPGWMVELTPDPVMLFRFSALTFNAHRIHYDQRYAMEIEGHRERVVHGPLVAILLAEMLRGRRNEPMRRFEFRARRPLFVGEPIRMIAVPSADGATLQAIDPSGAIAMEAASA